MLIKGITDEDFVNYKVPSMYIATATCSFKCDKEYGSPICQNGELAKQPTIDMSIEQILDRYFANPITHAIVIGGLEPLDQWDDISDLIFNLRYAGPYDEYQGLPSANHPNALDDIVIYTGYTKDEVIDMLAEIHCDDVIKKEDIEISWFSEGFPNIIIKFGRYIPNQQPHYDPVLGVYLASDNQYAERIS